MKNTDTLVPGKYYHVFNRAVGRDLIYTSKKEYDQFIQTWNLYISPIAYTYAYALIPNHFHFMIQIKREEEICKFLNIKSVDLPLITIRFKSMFGSYARSFNYRHNRMGKLFMLPYKRREIKENSYFTQIIYYIHSNPVNHGLVKHPKDWPYCSYSELTNNLPTWLFRTRSMEYFGGLQNFIRYHNRMLNLPE